MFVKIALSILFGLLLMKAWTTSADVFIGTTRSGYEKISLILLPFQGTSDVAEQAALAESVLQSDLERSGFFQIVERNKIISASTPIGIPDEAMISKAASAGVQVMAGARLIPKGNESILESYAYETSKGERVIGVQLIGTPKTVRALAHRFADKLVSVFTGEKGISETRIAYVSDISGRKEVYLMDYDGANQTRITGDQSIVVSPRWSFDAGQISYTSYREGNPDIYFFDLASGQRRRMIHFPGLNLSAAWSPKGDRVAFAATKDGNAEIYLIRPDGSDLKRVTFNTGDDLSPAWSPTGTQIAFTSDRGGTPQIYIMDADGSNVHRLTFVGDYNTSPTWSPKGDRIAYACRNDEKRLKLCTDSVDGQQTIRLTESGPWDDESPSWAPNGRDLAFTSNRAGKNQIYTIHADGTGMIRLTSNGASHTAPAWSPR
ncbi:MAG: Tol-Pal system beta propeller repeat protein TolB [Candidatus Manganitrophaceae bacterium]